MKNLYQKYQMVQILFVYGNVKNITILGKENQIIAKVVAIVI